MLKKRVQVPGVNENSPEEQDYSKARAPFSRGPKGVTETMEIFIKYRIHAGEKVSYSCKSRRESLTDSILVHGFHEVNSRM